MGWKTRAARFRAVISALKTDSEDAEVRCSRHLRHRSGRGVASLARGRDV